ncbi:MAG: TolC family protein [Polyangiales bacterium]
MRTYDAHFVLFSMLLALPHGARADDAALADFDLPAHIAQGPRISADEAAERAARTAPTVERAEALARAAEAAVSRTRDQLLPRLELSARYTHIDGFPDGTIALDRDPEAVAAARALADRVSDPAARTLWLESLAQPAAPKLKIPRNQTAFGARLSWPVSDLFFAIAPAIDAARAAARAADAQASARLARVRLSAREAYYQLARARGAQAVAERAVLQARAQSERIEAGVRAGMRPAADLAMAKARVAAADQAVVASEAGVDVADAALRTLLDDPDGAPYGIADALFDGAPVETPAPIATLYARARAQRPELRALRDQIVGQDASTRATRASGYPHLAVYAGADYARPNRYVIPPKDEFQPSWEVGASLTYAPNDTLAAAHRSRETRALREALEADMRELERGLTLELRQARAALVRAARGIETARAAEVAAEEAYATRLAELKVGASVTADLFAAEADLNRARLDALDAAIEQCVATARLSYAVGN